jgi:hypothetical protein
LQPTVTPDTEGTAVGPLDALTPTARYVVPGSHVIRRGEHGATMLETRADRDFVLPRVLYSASTPRHTLQNTGTDDLVVIGVELKPPTTR